MGAYNYIGFTHTCPACGAEARIRAQTHIASSYDGDSTGRFFNRDYRVGEVMRWWPQLDDRFGSWSNDAHPGHLPAIHEACYSACQECQAELCAVVEFADVRVVRVVQLTLESAWPDEYLDVPDHKYFDDRVDVDAVHAAMRAENRRVAGKRFQIAIWIGGIATLCIPFLLAWRGLAGFELAASSVAVFAALCMALTLWTRRPVAVVPGMRGFAIDCGLLFILSLAASLALDVVFLALLWLCCG